MKIELLENGSLKIVLTEEDMASMGLCFAAMSADDVATRQGIHTLLEAAKEETGFEAGAGVMVEVVPVDGGCLLLFTPNGTPRRMRMRRIGGPYIYEVDDADQLLLLAKGLRGCVFTPPRRASSVAGSSLYRFGNGYRLVLYPNAPLPRGMGHLLQELAHAAGEGDAAAAFTAEHGQPLAVGNALSRLCGEAGGASSYTAQ